MGTDVAQAELDAIAQDLRAVLRAGLPLRPELPLRTLLALAGVVARSVQPDDELARRDALDRLLRSQLNRLELHELQPAAALLFGARDRGGTLTDRRRRAADALGYEFDHFRKRIERRILQQLAWQLYRDSLNYVQRSRDGAPLEASGDSPTVSSEAIGDEDTAAREVLLSRLWSDVYGLRAELVIRESLRGAPEHAARFEEAAAGSLWYLARLLTRIDDYVDRYGQEILHGSASYRVEGLIRLAGWSGDVTPLQARELRLRLAQFGEWERDLFVKRVQAEALANEYYVAPSTTSRGSS